MHFAPWNIDNGKILTRRETATVLADLKSRAERSPNAHFNLILFRLAACCGLRVSEIARLRIGDVDVGKFRPHTRIRLDAAKGRRPRRIPLWWDRGSCFGSEVLRSFRPANRETNSARRCAANLSV